MLPHQTLHVGDQGGRWHSMLDQEELKNDFSIRPCKPVLGSKRTGVPEAKTSEFVLAGCNWSTPSEPMSTLNQVGIQDWMHVFVGRVSATSFQVVPTRL